MWTRSEFDIQHLKKARELSGKAREAEDLLFRSLARAQIIALPPFDWQDSEFPKCRDDGYAQSWEEATAAHAPREAITTWCDGLPEDKHELGGPRLPDPNENPSNYAGDHSPEWLGLFSSTEDFARGIDGDLDPGESESCIANRIIGRRIAKANITEPPRWYGTVKIPAQIPENPRALQSHYH